MSTKSRRFLAAACLATLVTFARTIPGVSLGDGVADFATGLAAALLFGSLVTWKHPRAQ